MRKKELTMLRLFLICSILILWSMNAMAQGYVDGNNEMTDVFLTVSDPGILGGAPTRVGNPATAAGFAGVGRAEVKIEMFAAPLGTPLAALETSSPIATTFNSGLALSLQGIVNFGNPFELPTEPGFGGSAPVEIIFSASGGDYFGWS
jgi:hypothetical protein